MADFSAGGGTAATLSAAQNTLTVREIIESSTTRATAITPTSGKRVRITSVSIHNGDPTALIAEVYFGTGADIDADETKAIFESVVDLTDLLISHQEWAPGTGPLGDTDEVVSIRTAASLANDIKFLIHYTEED